MRGTVRVYNIYYSTCTNQVHDMRDRARALSLSHTVSLHVSFCVSHRHCCIPHVGHNNSRRELGSSVGIDSISRRLHIWGPDFYTRCIALCLRNHITQNTHCIHQFSFHYGVYWLSSEGTVGRQAGGGHFSNGKFPGGTWLLRPILDVTSR